MTFPEMLTTYITIDDDIRSFLNTQTEKISVKKGTVISDQNTLNRKVYFVEKGLLRLHPKLWTIQIRARRFYLQQRRKLLPMHKTRR